MLKKGLKTVTNFLKAMLLPIIILAVFGVITQGRSTQWTSLKTVLMQSVYGVILSYASSFTQDMGMWNYGLGSVIYCAAILGGGLALQLDAGFVGYVLFPFVLAIILSAILGLVYNIMEMPLMICSLGMVLIFEAFCRLFFNGGGTTLPLSANKLVRAPWIFIYLVVAVALYYCVYNLTTFGKKMRAVGASQEISHAAGLNVKKIKFQAIVWGGVFCGLAASIYMANTIKIYPPAEFGSVNTIFDAMMGVFVASFLKRYINYSFAIVIGSVSIKLLQAGLVSTGMPTNVRNVCTGVFLLLLMTFSANQGRIGEYKAKKKLAAEIDMERAA